MSVDGDFGAAITAGDGTYSYGGLTAGTHKVLFSDCYGDYYASEWYRQPAEFGLRDPRQRHAGQRPPGYRCGTGGRRRRSRNGDGRRDRDAALPGICTSIIGPAGQFDAVTGDDGTYSIGALGTGSYKLMFRDCAGTGYAREWYDDRPDMASATAIGIVAGDDVVIDAGLAVGGGISGTVTDEVVRLGRGGHLRRRLCR